jgi:hypothetical protein
MWAYNFFSFKRLPIVMHVIGMIWLLFTLRINFLGLRTDSVHPFFRRSL